MYLLRRKIARTDGPQPVYKSAVDQTVLTWMPAAALLLACAVTPARAELDVRGYDWAPQSGWIATVAAGSGPSVAQRVPAITSGSASFRTATSRQSYDVRLNDGGGGGFGVPLDQPPAWQAAIDAQRSATTPARGRLDIRRYEWAPESGWLFTSLTTAPTVAQTWPAVLQGTGLSYRTARRPVLDVRRYEWAPTFGLSSVVDGTVRAWMAAVAGDHGARSRSRPALDVRGAEWSPEPAWIVSALPLPTTVAQQWPGVLLGLGLNYRSAERARLDVRKHDWAPSDAWVFTAQPVLPFQPAWASGSNVVLGRGQP